MTGLFFIENVEIDGLAGQSVAIKDGVIAAIGVLPRRTGSGLDGCGGALLPGLVDHHIHLLATAAKAQSIDLADLNEPVAMAARIDAAANHVAPGSWLRATGYHERIAGTLDNKALDVLAPRNPLRLQHATGELWMLNSAALEFIGAPPYPPGLELDGHNRPTGRLWRGDAWLRDRIGATPPPLAPLGRKLASYGITAVTDATVTTDARAATLLGDAHRSGALPQRLTLMSSGSLEPPDDGAFRVGPVKIVLDDDRLPELSALADTIRSAHAAGRAAAIHCVTDLQCAFAIAAWEEAGARAGDRIEHGSVIPKDAIAVLHRLGLTIVTQSDFIRTKGDRYASSVEPECQQDLYRCSSLQVAGIAVLGSSDAPYGDTDPWAAMRSAVSRRTQRGQAIAANERIAPRDALLLYTGGTRLVAGMDADFCLLRVGRTEALETLDHSVVAKTVINGKIVDCTTR